MRFGPNDKWWVVTDPRPTSELGDILFESTLDDLYHQFKGGLTMVQQPTLYTKRAEAWLDANARIAAMKTAHALHEHLVKGVDHIRVTDGQGRVLAEISLDVAEVDH